MTKKKKIGLALGSGAARGLAHIGVLEVLERESIPVDIIAGTSMGAVVGAIYASGKSAAELKEIAYGLTWKKLLPLFNPAAPGTGFIGNRKIKKFLEGIIGETTFADLLKPFACVATNITTGEEVIFNEGSVLEAIIASASLPVIFRASKWQGIYLVDGSLVNPVPVTVLKKMGADIVISVNVLRHAGKKAPLHIEDVNQKVKEPNIFNTLMQITNIVASQYSENCILGSDLLIEPDLSNIGFVDFQKARECVHQGELATEEALPQIKRLLA